MEELIAQMKGNYKPDQKTVKARLVEKYGDDILFTFQKNKKTVVCSKNIGGKMNGAFYQQKCKEKEERLRIVKAAAKIICDDIRSQAYDVSWMFIYDNADFNTQTIDGYNTFHVMGGMYTVGPASAVPPYATITRLTKIPAAEGGDGLKEIKIQDLSSKFQTSPSTYPSAAEILWLYSKNKEFDIIPGWSAFMEKATKDLSFEEIYTACLPFIKSPPSDMIQSTPRCWNPLRSVVQKFIYDNADFNTQTIDGYNTFHVMGGMYTVGPASAVPPDATITRLTKIPAAEGGDGLKEIKIQDLSSKFQTSPSTYPSAAEILWLYSKNKEFDIIPGWSAFMEKATKDLSFEEIYTACLPFIKSPPSDMIQSTPRCWNPLRSVVQKVRRGAS
ncbi:hypothetical protein JTB14_029558 [Gonioctena quinquepunctata]|nr:hypothetical protein JTB14_029558 [Gonioctena quinquepunctata]